jgi:hypothetical protein
MTAGLILGTMERLLMENPNPSREKLCFTMNTNDVICLGKFFGQERPNEFNEVKLYGVRIFHNYEVPEGNIYLGEKL